MLHMNMSFSICRSPAGPQLQLAKHMLSLHTCKHNDPCLVFASHSRVSSCMQVISMQHRQGCWRAVALPAPLQSCQMLMCIEPLKFLQLLQHWEPSKLTGQGPELQPLSSRPKFTPSGSKLEADVGQSKDQRQLARLRHVHAMRSAIVHWAQFSSLFNAQTTHTRRTSRAASSLEPLQPLRYTSQQLPHASCGQPSC